MSKAMFQRPEVASYFVQIVKEFGGMERVSWVSVARKLFSTYNYRIRSSQNLKSIYESLTNDSIELNLKQIGQVVQSYIEFRGESIGAHKRFKELSQIDIVHKRYVLQARQSLLKAVKEILQMFSRRKKHNFLEYQMLLVQSILAMISICDLKDLSDSLMGDMQIYAYKFEQFLLRYVQVSHLEQQTIFREMQQIMNRKDTAYITYYISLISELRQIFLNRYQSDDQLLNHPLLEKTIELNKSSLIYRTLIDKSDREEKYKIYNTIKLQDNNPYKLQINDMFPEQMHVTKQFNRQLQIKQVESKKPKTEKRFKMFRGLLTQEGDLVEKGWKTVIFKNEDEEMEEQNYDQEMMKAAAKKRNKMQQIYEQAFGSKP